MNAHIIRTELQRYYGNFETLLEHHYEEKIVNKLLIEDYSTKHEWATYNQLLLEIKHNLKNILLAKELQYRLTDNENPSQACIDVIKKSIISTPELNRLYDKILSFALNT